MTINKTDKRFLKEEIETLIDVFNLTNNTFFNYDELLVYNIKPFVPDQITNLDTDPNTQVMIDFSEKLKSSPITFFYRRLDIKSFLGPNQIAIEGNIDYSDEALFDYLNVILGIQLSPDYCLINRPLQLPNENYEFPLVLSFTDNNPLWTGSVTFNIVPVNHIELAITNQFFEGFIYPTNTN